MTRQSVDAVARAVETGRADHVRHLVIVLPLFASEQPA